MERVGRRKGVFLMMVLGAAVLASGCSGRMMHEEAEVTIRFSSGMMPSKAYDPDEERISDVSLMIFDENGEAEECLWLRNGSTDCPARLVTGRKYTFCACANFGYQVYAEKIGDLEGIIFHLAYPDEYRSGIPMFARQEVYIEDGMEEVNVKLERLMAKISLRMDRSLLSDDVEIFVRSVQIGNCPRRTSVFSPNKAGGKDELFPAGFTRQGAEAGGLNSMTGSGLSETVSLYMLENIQGKADAAVRKDLCSYIEMKLDYISDEYYSEGNGLIYRFFIGEGDEEFNVERNCHYHITVTPEDDGLSDDGWRVDKEDLREQGPASFRAYPSDYIVGDIGDKVHIWCEFSPSDAPFDVGISYMEDDKAEGIYDYEIDEDGRGATLTLTGPGRGLIYMEAGPPINDAALFIIEVNQLIS